MPGLLKNIDLWGQYLNNSTRTDENGSILSGAMPKDEWDKLSPAQQLKIMGQGTQGGVPALRPGDPGYDELFAQVGGEPGRNIYLTTSSMASPHPGDKEGWLVDPKKEYAGDGFFAHAEDNQTPTYQRKDDESPSYGKLIAAAAWPILAGYATGAFAGGGATGGSGGLLSGAEGGAMDMGVGLTEMSSNAGMLPTGLGDVAAGGYGTGAGTGAFDVTGSQGVFDSTGNPLYGGGPGAGASVTDLSIPAGGGSGNYAPVTDLSVPAEGSGGLLESLKSGGSGLLQWAVKNPMQAYGLVRMGAGLLGGHNGSGGGGNGGGGGGSSGGGGGLLNIPGPQFYQNPVTQSQIQNFQFAKPRGY
jgi:hypothetical protein